MQDPFAHLNLEQIQAAERKYRDQHPVLWWVAEFVMLADSKFKRRFRFHR
jgi:hypothetical protein